MRIDLFKRITFTMALSTMFGNLGAMAPLTCKKDLLFNAVIGDDAKEVKKLLDLGIDIGINSDGDTLLHLAAWWGTTRVVKTLLAAGATIDVWNREYETPLYLAAWLGHAEIVEALLTADANVHAKNRSGGSPLCGACIMKKDGSGSIVIVKELLAAGADVNTTDINGVTPLHRASFNGHTDIMKTLLTAGADVHATNCQGNTPLHRAVDVHSNTDATKLLLDAGASIHTKNQAGESPVDIAIFTKKDEIVKTLLVHTAPHEIEYVIPLIIKVKKQLGHDISKIITTKITQGIVEEKLARAKQHLSKYDKKKLRQEIENNLKAALKKPRH